jgi:hypothetical protein
MGTAGRTARRTSEQRSLVQNHNELKRSELLPVWLAVRVPVVHVLRVAARVAEPLQTLVALEWFLSAMEALVFREVVLVLERLIAYVAFVRALA